MTAIDEWFTTETTTSPISSVGILLNGRKLGIRWDAQSLITPSPVASPPTEYPANGYELKIWGSDDGSSKNRLVEVLAIGPQEINDRPDIGLFFFYQGSISGLTVPYRYAIVEFTNKTGEDLGSNDLRVWVADAEPLDVKVPVEGFWGSLKPRGTPSDSGSTVAQVRDYARVIRFLDVTVFINQPGILEFYEQSWNEMRLVSSQSVLANQQTATRFQRGGFPRFSLLIRNGSYENDALCEIVAIARHE